MNEKTGRQCTDFTNRLTKKYRHLSKWAKKNGVSCYRLYDADIPEIPVVVDVYEADAAEKTRYAQLALYERPYEKDEAEENAWFALMKAAAGSVLGISADCVFDKVRKRQKGEAQYEKISQQSRIIPVRECGVRFTVNLSDYLDTGLFFDHRPLRQKIRAECAGKDVLNLFCYTGSFSAYAALGGAAAVDSVDLSKNYLAWAERNLYLNVPRSEAAEKKYRFIHADGPEFLEAAVKAKSAFRNRWDIIILDPPTFSNSKRAAENMDINRDWPALTLACLRLLKPGGTLYFSTNSKKLRFDASLAAMSAAVRDITDFSIPEDFRGKKPHRCWQFTVS